MDSPYYRKISGRTRRPIPEQLSARPPNKKDRVPRTPYQDYSRHSVFHAPNLKSISSANVQPAFGYRFGFLFRQDTFVFTLRIVRKPGHTHRRTLNFIKDLTRITHRLLLCALSTSSTTCSVNTASIPSARMLLRKIIIVGVNVPGNVKNEHISGGDPAKKIAPTKCVVLSLFRG